MQSQRGKASGSTHGSRIGSREEQDADQRVFRMTYDTHDIRSAVISSGSQDVMSSLKERLAEKQYAGKTTSKTPSRVHAFLQNQFGGGDDDIDVSTSSQARPTQPQYEWERENSSIPRNSSIPSKVFQALQHSIAESSQEASPPPAEYRGKPVRQLSNDAMDLARSKLWEEQVLGMKSESRVPSRSFKLLQHLYDPDDEDTQSSASGGSASELQSALDMFEKELESLAQPDIQKTVVELPNFSAQRKQQGGRSSETEAPPIPVRNESFHRTGRAQSSGHNYERPSSKSDYVKDDDVEEAVVVAVAPVAQAQMMTYTAQVETPWILGQGTHRVPNKRINPSQEYGQGLSSSKPQSKPNSGQIPSQQLPSTSRQPQPAAGYRQFQPNKNTNLSNGNYRQTEPAHGNYRQLDQRAFYVEEQAPQGARSSPRARDNHPVNDKQQTHVTYASARRGSENANARRGSETTENDAELQKHRTAILRDGTNDNSAFSKVQSAKRSNMNIVTNSVGKVDQNNEITDNSSSERSITDDIDDVIKELNNFERTLNDRRESMSSDEGMPGVPDRIMPDRIKQTSQQTSASDLSKENYRETVPHTQDIETQVCQSKSVPLNSSNALTQNGIDDSLKEPQLPQTNSAISSSKQFSSVPVSTLLENRKPRPWIPQNAEQASNFEGNSIQQKQSTDSGVKEQHGPIITHKIPGTFDQLMRHVHPADVTNGHSKNVSPGVQVQRSNQRQLNITDKIPAKEVHGKRDGLTSPVTVHVQRRRSMPVESITDSLDDPNTKPNDFIPIRNGVTQIDHNQNVVNEGAKIVVASMKKRGSSDDFDDRVDSPTGHSTRVVERTSSSSSNGSVTSIKISSSRKERQESVSTESQQSISSSDEYDELFAGNDAVPYRISSRRKSSVKSTGTGVKINIPLYKLTVTSGTDEHLPEIQVGDAFQVKVSDSNRR